MWIAKQRHRPLLAITEPRSERRWIGPIYKAVGIAVGILIGFEVGGALLMLARYPQVQADQKYRLLEELVAENNQICRSWGLQPGTYLYDRCALDLDQVRQNERDRLQQEQDFFP